MSPVEKMLDLGIIVGVGTDNVMLNSPNMLRNGGFGKDIWH
jgi:cytosine/adenosine deaminase-related metal-dependent hydrolase